MKTNWQDKFNTHYVNGYFGRDVDNIEIETFIQDLLAEFADEMIGEQQNLEDDWNIGYDYKREEIKETAKKWGVK